MNEQYYKTVKWFLIGFLIWISLAVVAIILYIFLDYNWLKTFLDISSLFMNIFSILFCIYTWSHYIKFSKKQEEEHKEHIEYFKSIHESYPMHPSVPLVNFKPISFKRNRRNMSLLYMLAISVNLIAITYNLFF